MQQIAEWEAEARSELEHREFSLGRYYALYNSDSAPVGAFSRAPLAQLDVVAIPVKMTAEALCYFQRRAPKAEIVVHTYP